MSETSPQVSAVIVTRHRVAILRETLLSFRQSTYPIHEVIVSDDSVDDATARMLAEEFPEVIRTAGPRRGISANRNHGMSPVKGDYILLSDDDMVLDPRFIELALRQVTQDHHDLVFTGSSEGEGVMFPNTLGFLGFCDKLYRPGEAYITANQQCFLLSKRLALAVPYDEVIAAYGYEEMDYSYRVAASGYTIGCVTSCTNIHLAPGKGAAYRYEQDACRLYVTVKRYGYVDRRPLKALAFAFVAIPHHFLTSIRRAGLRKGVAESLSNVIMARRMLREFAGKMKAGRVHTGEGRPR